jgi:hypothetical protein
MMWHNTFPTKPYGARGMYFYEDILAAGIPETAKPYCCYICTIIFYKQPYKVVDGEFERWGEAVTRWNLIGERWTDQDMGFGSLAPLVLHNGQVYELATGNVIWKDGKWVNQWIGWRLPADDNRIIELKRLGWDPFQPGVTE